MDTNSITSPPHDSLAPGSIDELRDLFGRATLLAAAVADAVPPATGPQSTGLDMTVAELAEHLVVAARRAVCAGRALPLDQWPLDAADVAPGGWADALREAADDAGLAWTGVDPRRMTTLPWGVFPADNVLGVYLNEVTVHTWDLARATGQSPDFDDDVVAASSIRPSMSAIRP